MTMQTPSEYDPPVHPIGKYVVAVTSVAALTAAKLAVPALGREVPFILYFGAVLVAALQGGRGPGITATLLSAVVANVLFLGPHGHVSMSGSALLKTVVFIAEGLAITLLSDAARAAREVRERLVRARDEQIAAQAVQRRRIELLQAITAHLAEALTERQIAEIVVEETGEAIGASHGGIWLLREDVADLDLVYCRNYTEAMAAAFARVPLASPMPIARAVAERRLHWVESRAEYARRYAGAELQTRRLRAYEDIAFFCAPLAAGDELLGGFSLNFEEARAFDEADRRFVEAVADLAAQAIHRARLFDAERRAREIAARAQQEAERASRLKDEFLGVVSHELRTPLTAIVGWASLARDRPQGDLLKAVGIIERNARSLARLVDDLLDVSRVVSGKLQLEPRAMDAAAVLRAALAVVAPSAAAKGVTIHARLDPEPCPHVGDPDRMQQVFWNLLANAVKFTPGGGRVEVELVRAEASLRIAVRDTGRGIPADFLPYVFDRFRQADGSPSRRDGGLGLGLAIVRHLVELHGGEVAATSPGEGLGATFTVTLPARAVEAPEARASRPEPEPDATGERGMLHGMRLLLCEDDADAREVLCEALAREGAVVATAATASEALGAIGKVRPHVLVSDIGLPEIDGFDLLSSVRRLPPEEGGRTPAIAITAYARAEDVNRAVAAGYQVHLAKPIDPTRLVAAVRGLRPGLPA